VGGDISLLRVGDVVVGDFIGRPVFGAFVGAFVFGAFAGGAAFGTLVGRDVFGAFVGRIVFGSFFGLGVLGARVGLGSDRRVGSHVDGQRVGAIVLNCFAGFAGRIIVGYFIDEPVPAVGIWGVHCSFESLGPTPVRRRRCDRSLKPTSTDTSSRNSLGCSRKSYESALSTMRRCRLNRSAYVIPCMKGENIEKIAKQQASLNVKILFDDI
jgi:hypothetical protein